MPAQRPRDRPAPCARPASQDATALRRGLTIDRHRWPALPAARGGLSHRAAGATAPERGRARAQQSKSAEAPKSPTAVSASSATPAAVCWIGPGRLRCSCGAARRAQAAGVDVTGAASRRRQCERERGRWGIMSARTAAGSIGQCSHVATAASANLETEFGGAAGLAAADDKPTRAGGSSNGAAHPFVPLLPGTWLRFVVRAGENNADFSPSLSLVRHAPTRPTSMTLPRRPGWPVRAQTRALLRAVHVPMLAGHALLEGKEAAWVAATRPVGS